MNFEWDLMLKTNQEKLKILAIILIQEELESSENLEYTEK